MKNNRGQMSPTTSWHYGNGIYVTVSSPNSNSRLAPPSAPTKWTKVQGHTHMPCVGQSSARENRFHSSWLKQKKINYKVLNGIRKFGECRQDRCWAKLPEATPKVPPWVCVPRWAPALWLSASYATVESHPYSSQPQHRTVSLSIIPYHNPVLNSEPR